MVLTRDQGYVLDKPRTMNVSSESTTVGTPTNHLLVLVAYVPQEHQQDLEMIHQSYDNVLVHDQLLGQTKQTHLPWVVQVAWLSHDQAVS